MRTDSLNLSKQSIKELREYVVGRYSPSDIQMKSVLKHERRTQEAHEAIRPTSDPSR